MCRLLAVHDSRPFDIGSQVKQLAAVARNSREYQGDGWGCAWLEAGQWCVYRHIRPVWEDDLSPFGRTTLLLAHARSAFGNQGPDVANNMPFISGREVFIFNGEMRGVRIQAGGRIGAEKGVAINSENDDVVALLHQTYRAPVILQLIEAAGLLRDPEDPASVIPRLRPVEIAGWEGQAHGRIKRKLHALGRLFQHGSPTVIIADGRREHPVRDGLAGRGTVIAEQQLPGGGVP